jgi:hypothetical protein
MARSRNIKPAFFLNDLLATLAAWVRLLFIGLWTVADKAGRLADNPKRIGAALFPYESGLPLGEGLQQLHDAGFIRRYEIQGEPYIQILAWEKHQNPHRKETESVIPAYSNERAPEKPRLVPALPRLVPEKPERAPEKPERAGLIPSSVKPRPSPTPFWLPSDPARICTRIARTQI